MIAVPAVTDRDETDRGESASAWRRHCENMASERQRAGLMTFVST